MGRNTFKINNDFCFECNEPATQNHHVIPFSMGGTKTVPLCDSCHRLIHYGKKGNINHSALTKAGLQRTRANGTILGRKQTIDINHVKQLKSDGLSNRKIAKLLNCSSTAIDNIISK